MTRLHAVAVSVMGCSLAWAVGCGGGSTSPTTRVTGKLTCKGQPVAGANVTFLPAKGRPATGKTGADGRFTLSTYKSNDGAEMGDHKVSITMSWDDNPPPMPGSPAAKDWKPPVQLFADKYLNPGGSGLTATVEKGKNTNFEWDLDPK